MRLLQFLLISTVAGLKINFNPTSLSTGFTIEILKVLLGNYIITEESVQLVSELVMEFANISLVHDLLPENLERVESLLQFYPNVKFHNLFSLRKLAKSTLFAHGVFLYAGVKYSGNLVYKKASESLDLLLQSDPDPMVVEKIFDLCLEQYSASESLGWLQSLIKYDKEYAQRRLQLDNRLTVNALSMILESTESCIPIGDLFESITVGQEPESLLRLLLVHFAEFMTKPTPLVSSQRAVMDYFWSTISEFPITIGPDETITARTINSILIAYLSSESQKFSIDKVQIPLDKIFTALINLYGEREDLMAWSVLGAFIEACSKMITTTTDVSYEKVCGNQAKWYFSNVTPSRVLPESLVNLCKLYPINCHQYIRRELFTLIYLPPALHSPEVARQRWIKSDKVGSISYENFGALAPGELLIWIVRHSQLPINAVIALTPGLIVFALSSVVSLWEKLSKITDPGKMVPTFFFLCLPYALYQGTRISLKFVFEDFDLSQGWDEYYSYLKTKFSFDGDYAKSFNLSFSTLYSLEITEYFTPKTLFEAINLDKDDPDLSI